MNNSLSILLRKQIREELMAYKNYSIRLQNCQFFDKRFKINESPYSLAKSNYIQDTLKKFYFYILVA